MPERGKIEETAPAEDVARSHKSADGTGREPVPRGVYVSMRLQEIGVEIAEKARERERLTSILKDPSREDDPGRRSLRQRRAYVADRIAMLRKEQADLQVERRMIGAAAEPDAGIGKRDDGRDGVKKNPLIN